MRTHTNTLACRYTNIAVTKNFVGSPHRDEFDIAHQYVCLEIITQPARNTIMLR